MNSKNVKVYRLRHIGLVVSDINKFLNIFLKLFNLKLILKPKLIEGQYITKLVGLKNTTIKSCILKLKDNSRLELIQYLIPKPKKKLIKSNDIGVSHFAISVNSINNLYEKSKKYRIRFISEPIFSLDKSVKVAYIVIANEILCEVVEVLNKKALFSGDNK
jgi:hypothetical protein